MSKSNPCKDCKYAYVRNNRHRPSVKTICMVCDERKKHIEYLVTRRKYEPGAVITSLDELLKYDVVYWNGKVKNRAFIQNLQLHTAKMGIDRKSFREAKKTEREV